MKNIKYALFLILISTGLSLSAQSNMPSNEDVEKSLEKVEEGMDFMLGFFDQFSKEMLQGLNIEGLQDAELREADKEVIRESMKEGFQVLKNIDVEKLEGLLREMESQFKDLDFGELYDDSEKTKKKKSTKI